MPLPPLRPDWLKNNTDGPQSSPGSSVGLPDDEFRRLQGRNRISRVLSIRYSSDGDATQLALQRRLSHQPGDRTSREQRLLASEMRYATRRALRPSFDFTDESYNALQEQQRLGGYDSETPPAELV